MRLSVPTGLYPRGIGRGETMVSTVCLTLSQKDWEEALQESEDIVARYGETPELLPGEKLADLLRDVMMVALQRHHAWLTLRGIRTVISPGEISERTYIFQFETPQEARLFREKFGGELITPPLQ